MHAQWKRYLENAGAQFEDECIRNFGSIRREAQVAVSGLVFCDLNHLELIRVSGPDAPSFLHNLLTNDIHKLPANEWQLNALCNPKGRVIATVRVFVYQQDYYLALAANMANLLIDRLKPFILRSKVTLENCHGQFCHFGLSGAEAATQVQAIVGAVPERVHEMVTAQEMIVIKTPGRLPRFELYLSPSHAQTVWEKLDVHGAAIGDTAWQLIDVRAGLVHIDQALTERYVPQMLNLDLIQGLSFQKGCYPGQEIVARMHYRGKLKRHLYYASAKSETLCPPGTGLFQPGLNLSQDAGQVVSCAWAPDDGIELLAVIPIEIQAQGDLHLHRASGPKLQFKPLPDEHMRPTTTQSG
jgi:tRNA-modifying protein YgfZ